MRTLAQGLPLGMRCSALLGVVRKRSGTLRLSKSMVAVTLLSALLAACADSEVADASRKAALKQPIKASKADPRRASGSPIKTSSIATSSIGIAKTEKVDLPYRPAVGSRWIGTVELRETTTKAGRIAESTVVRERGEYVIAHRLEKGYQVTYTLGQGSLEGNAPLAQLMAPLIESMKGQSFTFETDENGVPVRISDVARWSALAQRALDALALSQPEFASVPQLKQFLDALRSRYDAATPETGVELFLHPLLQFSMVQGLTDVAIGEERSYDDEVVIPLIGAMRAKGSYRIASVDKAQGLATIQWRLTILPEDLNRAAREVAKGLLPADQDPNKLLDAMAQMKMEHLDQATYKVALADGVVRRMDRTAIFKTQGVERKTVMIMTMSPAP